MDAQTTLQKILRERYEDARIKNPAFSIRAFAKHSGLSPATLSLVLNGKRKVSRKLLARVSERLMLDPQERAELLDRFPSAKNKTAKGDSVDRRYLMLTADQYQLVADWKAFAILNLIHTRGFRNDPKWIAQRLGVSEEQVRQTIDRLLRLEMIKVDSKGKMARASSHFRTSDDIVNLSLRKSHYENLELARNSLDQDSVDMRDFTWLTLPLDLRKLKTAKTLIRKFQDDLLALLAEEAEPSEVYRMAIQFFPLTKIRGDSK